MRRVTFIIIIVLTIISFLSARDCAYAQGKSIVMFGHGYTKEEALKNCLTNASKWLALSFIYAVEEKDQSKFIENAKTAIPLTKEYVTYTQVSYTKLPSAHIIALNINFNYIKCERLMRKKFNLITISDIVAYQYDTSNVRKWQETNRKLIQYLKRMNERPAEERYKMIYATHEINSVSSKTVNVALKTILIRNPFFAMHFCEMLRLLSDKSPDAYTNNEVEIIMTSFYRTKKGKLMCEYFHIPREFNIRDMFSTFIIVNGKKTHSMILSQNIIMVENDQKRNETVLMKQYYNSKGSLGLKEFEFLVMHPWQDSTIIPENGILINLTCQMTVDEVELMKAYGDVTIGLLYDND